jgi:hypothetical protein
MAAASRYILVELTKELCYSCCCCCCKADFNIVELLLQIDLLEDVARLLEAVFISGKVLTQKQKLARKNPGPAILHLQQLLSRVPTLSGVIAAAELLGNQIAYEGSEQQLTQQQQAEQNGQPARVRASKGGVSSAERLETLFQLLEHGVGGMQELLSELGRMLKSFKQLLKNLEQDKQELPDECSNKQETLLGECRSTVDLAGWLLETVLCSLESMRKCKMQLESVLGATGLYTNDFEEQHAAAEKQRMVQEAQNGEALVAEAAFLESIWNAALLLAA